MLDAVIQAPIPADISALAAASRAAARLEYRLIFSESPAAVIRGGIHPVQTCLDRLRWFQLERVDGMVTEYRAGGIKLEFLNAVKTENPARIEAMRRDLLSAIAFEMKAHGCILLPKVRIQ